MDILAGAQRRAFSVWLRTGRLPKWLKDRPAEFKFNPWHDPENGRFTFAGTGRYFGRRSGDGIAADGAAAHSDRRPPRGFSGGGGSFGGGGAAGSYGGGGRSGGGGATGSWDAPTPDVKPQPKQDLQDVAQRSAVRSTQAERDFSPGIAKRAAEENWRRVERNGYTYLVDARGRTRYVLGAVATNNAQTRSRSAQARAGGEDRRTNDHGGHYIARRFNGPTEAFNHFAQDANFNRSGYFALENQWARAKREGKRVQVKIEPVYEGSSQRPSRINVWFWIDGKQESLQFPNESQETSHAKR